MFLTQLAQLARSLDRLRLGLALTVTLAACGAPEAQDAPAATAAAREAGAIQAQAPEEEAPAAAQPQEIISGDCLRSFNQCNARCAQLGEAGQDVTICYSDCSAQLYNCQCRRNPRACFQG